MSFELVFPQTVEEAVGANQDGARWFAGGTDLMPEIKLDLAAPARLVNLKRVDGLRGIQETSDGVNIGALTTLAEIASHDLLRTRYRALAQACELAASPQIRNMATIGGNLCQDSRCAYYRNGFNCFLRGGDTCFMREGENREAAVIGYRDCVHVHPSDPANALVAFDAQVVAQGRGGERTIAVENFFRAPDANDRRMNVLNADEMITAIVLPRVADNTRSAYVKAMDRAAWAFALGSACVRLERADNGQATAEGGLKNVRVVLGGVAPMPWRELRIEKTLSETKWVGDLVTQGFEEILEKAAPLSQNGYKLRLARGLLKRALGESLLNRTEN